MVLLTDGNELRPEYLLKELRTRTSAGDTTATPPELFAAGPEACEVKLAAGLGISERTLYRKLDAARSARREP